MSTFFEYPELINNVDNYIAFYNLLTEWSKKFNITSILDEKGVAVKHFIDSIYGKDLFENGKKVIEIGSGGGFPSVPLKIERNDLDFTLVEATKKKCDFLNAVSQSLGFENFDVVNGRCEDISKDGKFREKYDYAVARAVAPLNSLVEYLLPFLKVGGKAICYKGSNYLEELDSAKNAISVLGGKLFDVKNYTLPCEAGDRAIIVIEKVKKTLPLYPRTESKIRKSPL